MARSRTNRTPALAAAALLHGAVLALAILSLQWGGKRLTVGSVVPVEIVNGPPADAAPAVQAPEPTPAQAPEPDPQATQPAASPAPPTPAPPTPTPKQATPTPPVGKPTATATAKPAPLGQGKPAKGLNLDQLASSIAHAKPSRPTKSFSLADLEASLRKGKGRQGPPRQQAAPQTGQGTQDHISASSVNGLAAKLQELWNPNCDVEGAAGINVKVRIHFGPGGTLTAAPELVDRSIDPLSSTLMGAAAHRALSAVVRGAPFTDLPPNFAGDVIVNFNAKQACARR